jgi:vancomycin permeability regulator SanA
VFRLTWRLAKLVALLLALYIGFTAAHVVWASRRDEAAPADAIVVFGAAQYNGRPSPVFQARLDHAADLYDREIATTIWVTGGRGAEGEESEASVASKYLIQRRGVDADDVRLEVQGRDSWHQLAAVARILRREGATEVVLVSDGFHNARIKAIADELGLDPKASATSTSPISGRKEAEYLVRETGAMAIGRIVGFRRLSGISDTARTVRDQAVSR